MEETIELKQALKKATDEKDFQRALDILDQLGKQNINIQTLKSTKIGLFVNTIAHDKSMDKCVKKQCKALVASWKSLVSREKETRKKETKKNAPKHEKMKKKKRPRTVADKKLPGTGNILPPPEVELLPRGFSTGVVDRNRIRVLTVDGPVKSGPVMYWMSRDQRVQDNWALLWARELAQAETDGKTVSEKGLCVVFNVVDSFLNAPLRHYDFMLKGLEEVEATLSELNIPFMVTVGDPETNIPELSRQLQCSSVVVDYSPLKLSRQWKEGVTSQLESQGVHFYEVDAHNIVPVWVASDRQEWSAATFRRRINTHIPKYFNKVGEIPQIEALDDDNKERIQAAYESVSSENMETSKYETMGNSCFFSQNESKIDWTEVRSRLTLDDSVSPVNWIQPGTKAAMERLARFLSPSSFAHYKSNRNHPDKSALSGLSPWLHYGHISAQRVAWEASEAVTSRTKESFDSFFEELVIRRELSDNYCHFQPEYDNYDGLPPWAKITLEEHEDDKRQYIYTEEQLEKGRTHDNLWNAAQKEMVETGKMHGYVRMYWAKKILEWTLDPSDALDIANRQNNKYELDGRDPNGYVGCAWAIGGVHDRAWTERTIFGKIRYMNYAGCKRKFSIDGYIAKVKSMIRKR